MLSSDLLDFCLSNVVAANSLDQKGIVVTGASLKFQFLYPGKRKAVFGTASRDILFL